MNRKFKGPILSGNHPEERRITNDRGFFEFREDSLNHSVTFPFPGNLA